MKSNFMHQISRLCIGGANLGQLYGQINPAQQQEGLLLDLWNFGVRKIDISNGYPNSEEIVLRSGLPWQVQYKIGLPTQGDLSMQSIKTLIAGKISKFQSTNQIRILIHNTDIVINSFSINIFSELSNYVKSLGVQEFGISTYSRNEFDLVSKEVECEIVQFPLNIFDNRFFTDSTNIITSRTIYQARSIFLQGLLLRKHRTDHNLENLPEVLKWRNFTKRKGVKALECCLAQVLNNPLINEIVVGFDSSKHVDQLMAAMHIVESIDQDFSEFKSNNINLIDPRKWVSK